MADPEAHYFGTRLNDGSLVSDNNPRLGRITFDQWFATSARRNDRLRRDQARRIRSTRKGDSKMIKSLLAAPLAIGCPGLHRPLPRDATPASKAAKVTLVYEHELPNVPGKSMKGVLVEYGPGGFSEGHTHPTSAFIYATVLEGSIRSQVNDGPVKVYKAGESFSEMPGDRHGVSANGSTTKPAKLLAVFVVDTNQKELTFPLKK